MTGFSRRSRNRLRTVAASLDWHAAWKPGLHMLMVTLTYPGDWRAAAPTPDVVNRHRIAFLKRFERATGHRLAHIWKREFQERGAPHLHLYGWWPRKVGDLYLIAWVSKTWYEVVGTGLREHLNAGTRVDYRQSFDMSNPLRVAFYFSGYASSKGSKEYQNEAPEGWVKDNGSVGRYWGRVGLDTILAEIPVTRADAITIERLLRGVLRSVAYPRPPAPDPTHPVLPHRSRSQRSAQTVDPPPLQPAHVEGHRQRVQLPHRRRRSPRFRRRPHPRPHRHAPVAQGSTEATAMSVLVVHTTTAGGTNRPDPPRECAPSASSVVRRSGPHQSVSDLPALGPGDGNPTRANRPPHPLAASGPRTTAAPSDHQPTAGPVTPPRPQSKHAKDTPHDPNPPDLPGPG